MTSSLNTVSFSTKLPVTPNIVTPALIFPATIFSSIALVTALVVIPE